MTIISNSNGWAKLANEGRCEDASPLARMVYLCEIGEIDQHLSPYLLGVASELETNRDFASYADKRITELEQMVLDIERQNALLVDACEDAVLHLENEYSTFDFEAWRKSWGKGKQLHYGEKLMNKLQAAIDGGALEDNNE